MQQVKKITSILLMLLVTQTISASDDFSVEDYGLLPNIRSVSISPDGKHYAYIKRGPEGDYFIVVNLEQQKAIGGINASKVKARSVYFATNQHVILFASDTVRSLRVKGKWEKSGATVYNLKSKKLKPLLDRNKTKNLYIAQSGLGRIAGINRSENFAYMPAYTGNESPAYSLLRVNLDTGRSFNLERGNNSVTDWFVNENGKVFAREEYDKRKQEHRVLVQRNNKWEAIYKKATKIPKISVVAVSQDGQSLIIRAANDNYRAVYSMSLTDGEISEPLYAQADRDVDAILTDGLNRKLSGVSYSGLLPNAEYVDLEVQNNLAAVQDIYPGSAVRIVSRTEDNSKLIISASGNEAASDYMIFDAKSRRLTKIGSAYSRVSKDKIGKVRAIRYKARDGLAISAILTQPVGVDKIKNLPLIVFPHGGPESYDQIRFNWWAQYLARKGYLVLQPNFRGSTGFGYEFRNAGRGKWGKEMQDDISDGVQAMIKAGYADPERVCIMGASYGGYAALAGGAFTPDLYRCVIAVAGVSDLPRMLRDEKRDHGRNHWVVSYWNKVIGNSKTEREKLKEVSPVNAAANFKAPLLMLHGKDDTVVPIKQSQVMFKAMKKADKQVDLIALKGEDHWLSDSETRLETLRLISGFLDEHNPTNKP